VAHVAEHEHSQIVVRCGGGRAWPCVKTERGGCSSAAELDEAVVCSGQSFKAEAKLQFSLLS
jgi:hypothetical protein